MSLTLVTLVAAVGGGLFFRWVATKCKGRNAQKASNYMSAACWLLLLPFIPIPVFGLGWLLNNIVVKLIPSVLCGLAAASNLQREIRAQQRGDYTDPAV